MAMAMAWVLTDHIFGGELNVDGEAGPFQQVLLFPTALLFGWGAFEQTRIGFVTVPGQLFWVNGYVEMRPHIGRSTPSECGSWRKYDFAQLVAIPFVAILCVAVLAGAAFIVATVLAWLVRLAEYVVT